MTQTATATDLANVPHPAGATRVYEWEAPQATGYPQASRYFVGSTSAIEVGDAHHKFIGVRIDGTQYADGRIERVISIDDVNLTLEHASRVGAALLTAVEEIEGN
ncbi:MAG: hypothetical protein QOK02_2889 [Mycobacterium sp.]|nr:hypothetical protein [Mycobacterium sp.]